MYPFIQAKIIILSVLQAFFSKTFPQLRENLWYLSKTNIVWFIQKERHGITFLTTEYNVNRIVPYIDGFDFGANSVRIQLKFWFEKRILTKQSSKRRRQLVICQMRKVFCCCKDKTFGTIGKETKIFWYLYCEVWFISVSRLSKFG